jgi:hypothetical protein
MKNKKSIAVILSIGIAVSGFSQIITTYAQNSMEEVDFSSGKAPEQNITSLEPELFDQNVTPNKDVYGLDNQNAVLYQGIKIRANSKSTKDLYNLGEDEIETLLESGFSIQDIYEADEISNELFVNPVELLNMKKESNKSLTELRSDIINQRKESSNNYLKNKYKNDFKTLQEQGLNEEEIFSLLAYADINNLQVNKELIMNYKNKGSDVFKAGKNKLSDDTKKKYGITDNDSAKLSDELIQMFEKVSKVQINQLKSSLNLTYEALTISGGNEYEKSR